MTEAQFTPGYYFDPAYWPLDGLYNGVKYVWEVLERLPELLDRFLVPGVHPSAKVSPGAFIGERVSLGEGVVVEHGASIPGPAILGDGCVVRSGAYIRGGVLAGAGSILGYCCEFKNCILHKGAEVYHFAYVGDSILGHRAHLGAGVKISNVKLSGGTVTVSAPDGCALDTGLQKFGAVLGDSAEVGCNAVLNPGSLLGPRSIVYPGASWRGCLAADTIAKVRQSFELVERRRRDLPPSV